MDVARLQVTVDRLLSLPSPHEHLHWPNSDYLKASGFQPSDADDLICVLEAASLVGNEQMQCFDEDDTDDVIINAYRLISELAVSKACPSLLRLLSAHDRVMDDLTVIGDEFAFVLHSLGDSVVAPLIEFSKDQRQSEFSRVISLRALGMFDRSDESTRAWMGDLIQYLLREPFSSPVELNTACAAIVYEWRLADLAEVIEKAYSANRVDTGSMGPWKDFQKVLQSPLRTEPSHDALDAWASDELTQDQGFKSDQSFKAESGEANYHRDSTDSASPEMHLRVFPSVDEKRVIFPKRQENLDKAQASKKKSS